MRRDNKTRYAVLGALIEHPRSGYEIKTFMQRSTHFFWRESDATIYPTLKLLAKEGLVKSSEQFVGKKKKEVFSITPDGLQVFEQWIESPTGDESVRHEFLLKLFFLTDTQKIAKLVKERITRLKSAREEYSKILSRLEQAPPSAHKSIRQKMLYFAVEQAEHEVKWLLDKTGKSCSFLENANFK